MSRAFHRNLSDFLDNEGSPAASLSLKSKKLLQHLSGIIRFVSIPATIRHDNPLRCWNAPQRKRCKGFLDASIDLQQKTIFWHCLVCGNHGSISQWQNSLWDEGYRE